MRRSRSLGARALSVLSVVAVTTSGCGGSTATSATSSPSLAALPSASESALPAPESAVVRMAVVPGLADAHVEAFLDQLGSADSPIIMQPYHDIDVQLTLGAEQDIIRAVADGSVELGWVGARAFRELGVSALDPLIAPMLLQSTEAQRAVLTSDLPAEMLAGLEPLGVTGLAIFGGPIRRPSAADAAFTSLDDFSGIPFYAWHGNVNAMAVEALGAQHVDLAPEDRNAAIEDGSIRGYETTIGFLEANADWRTNRMTLNLNLWPSIGVLVANPDALAALSEDARTDLMHAAHSIADQSLDLVPDGQVQLEAACRAGATFALAADTDLAAINAAFDPVFEELRSDPTVAAHLDEIERLTEGIQPELFTVPDECLA